MDGVPAAKTQHRKAAAARATAQAHIRKGPARTPPAAIALASETIQATLKKRKPLMYKQTRPWKPQ